MGKAIFRTLATTSASIAALAGASSSAMAQDAAGADTAQLQDIVVTAQKREENLQRAPLSVTAITADDLASKGISEVKDLQGLVPAVEFIPISNLLVAIRGVTSFNLQPGNDPPIAYNIDGNYLSHPYALPAILLDLERVEVVRGPQGTLSGRNANGGSVNFVTAKPTDAEIRGHASAQIGNYSLFTTEAALNLPLGPGYAIRAAFGTTNRDGYLRNGFDDADHYAGRLRFMARPTNALEILLTADYSRLGGNGLSGSYCPPASTFITCQGVRWDPQAGFPGQPDADFIDIRNKSVYGSVTYDFAWARLIALGSWRDVDYRQKTDFGDNFSYVPDIRNRLLTGELRLESPASSPVKWVVGIYHADERLKDRTRWTAGATGNDALTADFDINPYKSRSTAAFAQVTIPLAETIRFTGGARYTNDRKSSVATNVFYAPTGTVSSTNDVSVSYGRVTWKAGLDVDIADNSLLYASAGNGFKAGGTNNVLPALGLPDIYEPERIMAYQAGTKNRFLHNRLQLNAEVFYYDYHGLQVLSPVFSLQGAGIATFSFPTVNTQKARFYGGEMEASALIGSGGKLDVSVALLDATYTRFVLPTSLGGADLSGSRAPNAPGVSFTVGYEQKFELGRLGQLRAHAQTHYTGAQWLEYNHALGTPFDGSRQKGYFTSQADLTWTAPRGGYYVTVWMRNIENSHALLATSQFIGSAFQTAGYPQPPRTYGVKLGVDF